MQAKNPSILRIYMDLQTRITRTDRTLSSPIDEELVMFDTEAGKYYGLNEVATKIWEHLEKEITVDELCDHLTEEFDITLDECRKQVLDFLPKLKEKKLIKEVG